MFDIGSLAGGLAGIAEKLIPAIIPGAGPVIEAGKALVNLMNDVKPHIAGTPQNADFQAKLDALEQRVLAHADKTIESLGDGTE